MKRTLFLSIFLVLLASFAVAGYVFSYKYLSAMRDKVLVMEVASAERDTKDSKQGGVHQLFVATAIEREALSRYFVRQEEVATAVERLERIGKEEGVVVEVSGIGIGEASAPEKEGDKRIHPIDISVQSTGSRAATERFLKRIELFPYILSIEEISLEKLKFIEGKEDSWRLALSFRVGMIR